MPITTVALDREAYNLLKSEKRKGESFSDVVKRVMAKRRPLTEFIGIWKSLSRSDVRKIKSGIQRSRELDRRRLKRMLEE